MRAAKTIERTNPATEAVLDLVDDPSDAEMEALTIGDSTDESTDIGPHAGRTTWTIRSNKSLRRVAVELATGSTFGLGGSIWTETLDRSERLARRIESGCVFVNEKPLGPIRRRPVVV